MFFMKKRLLSILLVLVMCLGLLPAAASAAQKDDLAISFKTAVYSISKEAFVRWIDEPASQSACGKDEYVTVCAEISNPSNAAVTLQKPCISIDGGEKLYWTDLKLEAGKTVSCHVFHVHADLLTPGLHTAEVFASGKSLASGHFSIGRDWSKIFKFPTEKQVAARPADRRSPYLATWLDIGQDVRYDAYSIDFKSDHIPYGTYSCLFNGDLDLTQLKKQYVSVESEGPNLYGGLQLGDKGRTSNFILSFWDIHCTDKNGKVTTIRPVRTYPAEKTDNDEFGNEGTGAHTLGGYDWKAGRWYRMLLRCGTSKTTDNTTVEQWFQDLTTGDWTHTCTYDTGVKGSSFEGNTALFSENFLPAYAGGVRSLEFANVRVHTSKGWQDVTGTYGIHSRGSETDSSSKNYYGSWEAGADGNTFYMISTGVTGWGRSKETGKLTVKNRESGDPLGGKPLRETARSGGAASKTQTKPAS